MVQIGVIPDHLPLWIRDLYGVKLVDQTLHDVGTQQDCFARFTDQDVDPKR